MFGENILQLQRQLVDDPDSTSSGETQFARICAAEIRDREDGLEQSTESFKSSPMKLTAEASLILPFISAPLEPPLYAGTPITECHQNTPASKHLMQCTGPLAAALIKNKGILSKGVVTVSGLKQYETFVHLMQAICDTHARLNQERQQLTLDNTGHSTNDNFGSVHTTMLINVAQLVSFLQTLGLSYVSGLNSSIPLVQLLSLAGPQCLEQQKLVQKLADTLLEFTLMAEVLCNSASRFLSLIRLKAILGGLINISVSCQGWDTPLTITFQPYESAFVGAARGEELLCIAEDVVCSVDDIDTRLMTIEGIIRTFYPYTTSCLSRCGAQDSELLRNAFSEITRDAVPPLSSQSQLRTAKVGRPPKHPRKGRQPRAADEGIADSSANSLCILLQDSRNRTNVLVGCGHFLTHFGTFSAKAASQVCIRTMLLLSLLYVALTCGQTESVPALRQAVDAAALAYSRLADMLKSHQANQWDVVFLKHLQEVIQFFRTVA